ncbi:MAG TPA: alpha/beta hydrolase [Gaiellales bacterium]
MHEQTLAVGGVRVNLVEWGTAGPAVVLLHGLTGSRAYLQPLAERLAATHRVIAIDLPGHGGSDMIEPFTFEAAARLMSDACAELGAERPVVIGHSFGAPLAVAWAAERPVAGILACSPVGMIPLELRRARYVLPFHRGLAACEPLWEGAAVSRPLGRRMVFGWFVGMAGLAGLERETGRVMLRDAARAAPAVRAVLPALATLDLARLCAAVDVPALVIWGDHDRSGWENGPPLAAALRAPGLALPGVGHMPMLETPYAFSVAVREFLSATVPG